MLDVLAIAAHPDDAEIFCGGTLALLSSQGYKVGIVDLTHGELASQGSVETRAQESKNANAILKLAHRENLGFPDGGILETDEHQVHTLVKCLRNLKPQLLMVPYVQDRHPDHMQASLLVDRASFFANLPRYKPESGNPHQPLQVVYYQSRTAFSPTFLVNVSNSYDTKLAAIKAYSSQISRAQASNSLISSPLSVSSIMARDEYYGSMLGVKHAEPFYTKTAIGISDPLAFFRANTVREPLASPARV